MHNIKYSKQAEIDINDAISYIAQESLTNALDYLSRYEKMVELLQLNPFMGADCKSKLIKRECRILVHESHLIIYKIDENKKEIVIIRIYHSSVDYANKINNEKIG